MKHSRTLRIAKVSQHHGDRKINDMGDVRDKVQWRDKSPRQDGHVQQIFRLLAYLVPDTAHRSTGGPTNIFDLYY